MWRKCLLGLAFILIFSLVGLFLTAKPIIRSYALNAFADAGCVEPKISGLHIRFQQVVVDELECDFRQEEFQLLAKAKSVEIFLPWLELLEEKEKRSVPIHRLKANELDLSIPKQRIVLPKFALDMDLENLPKGEIKLSLDLQESESGRPIWIQEYDFVRIFLKESTKLRVNLKLDSEQNLNALHVLEAGTIRFGARFEQKEHRMLLTLERLSLVGNIIAGKIVLQALNSYAPVLPIVFSGDINSMNIDITAKGKLQELRSANLREYQGVLPEGLEIVSTIPALDARLQLEAGVPKSGNIRMSLHSLFAKYKKTEINEGTLHFATSIRSEKQRIRIQPKLLFSVSEIDAGFPLKNLVVELQTSPFQTFPSHVDVKKVSADVFGGKLFVSPKRLKLKDKFQSLNLAFKDINLAEILKLDTKSRVKGSGTIDGSVPVLITKEGIAIDNGNLTARSPGGFLQYKDEASGAVGETNESLGIALQALENFQYSELRSGVLYEPDGKLVFALHLKGKNPELFDGKPVHFNINVEQNLLQLLKSLRLTDGLEDSIDRKFSK